MKKAMKLIPAVAIALCFARHPASAQELSKQAKIERILAATNSSALVDQMFNQIKLITAGQAPAGTTPEERARLQEAQSKIMDLVRASVNKLLPQYAKMYDETFSDDEIDGIYAFYQSPAGKSMVQKTPLLVSKLMGMMQAQMTDLTPEIQRIAREASGKK
jgi:hypothetical protein